MDDKGKNYQEQTRRQRWNVTNNAGWEPSWFPHWWQKAGIAAMAFSVVPEPAAASVGLLGPVCMMMCRRRG
ncbi:hypothetical protein C5O12_11015 [Akkermansia muciniphila]|nr:hypothetical protein C1O40_11725 [Akkermansia muciniphila]QAA62949.1 hypothetical protein C1O59_11010 [Akkermansia muciniphila]QHV12583.1 hypothetical protein C5N97_11200 [Akkermansia muciniphila]QHV19834.1 hypothetical protein C5O11_11350 [Akkermansia muciniphila]QHV22119.1 hypothetical protein C5O12_11015 [Akkermansia muciniphila]